VPGVLSRPVHLLWQQGHFLLLLLLLLLLLVLG
jgi:hypothetical protein